MHYYCRLKHEHKSRRALFVQRKMSDVCSDVCCAAALGALVCVLAAGELLLGESLRLPRQRSTYSDSGAVAGPLGQWTTESLSPNPNLNADPVGSEWSSSQEADGWWPEFESQLIPPVDKTPLLFYIADAGTDHLTK